MRPRSLPEGEGRIIALTDPECAALLQAAIGSSDPDGWLFVAIGLGTSMRHAEILRIRWEQFDLPRRRLFIPLAKAGSRAQPITPELADLLSREKRRCETSARVGCSHPANGTV